MTLYERYVAELTSRERRRYYEEMKTVGEAYAIPRSSMPADYVAFRRYWAEMLADGLRVTETTRDVAEVVLHPDLPAIAWPAIGASAPGHDRHPARRRSVTSSGWTGGQAASACSRARRPRSAGWSRSCPRSSTAFPTRGAGWCAPPERRTP